MRPKRIGVRLDFAIHAAYGYDPLGRRTHKSGTGVTETWFLNDGDDEIVEYDSPRTLTVRYIPGPAISYRRPDRFAGVDRVCSGPVKVENWVRVDFRDPNRETEYAIPGADEAPASGYVSSLC